MTETNNAKTANAEIVATDLSVVYNGTEHHTVAIKELNFHVSHREFVCFLGTSGCGKSTILKVLAGFIKPTSGTVHFQGKPIDGPNLDRGFVFQQHSLFSWKTVRGNIEFGLRMRGMEAGQRKEITEEYIRLVGLTGFEKSYPEQLSGGMQQRVGLARALASNPSVIMMDEPFGSLDAQTRGIMQELLLGIWTESRKTIVFVTHDVDEAIVLADRIIVLTARPGHVKTELVVPLLRPRDQKIVVTPEFISIKRQVMESIREETMKLLPGR
ncbi:MAG: ABC transporter ATP-binding protein [Candidatus Latescibacter sp.]|nr:ABC transporter ATP-binding protein [Candidatus Latescibacter sp.]